MNDTWTTDDQQYAAGGLNFYHDDRDTFMICGIVMGCITGLVVVAIAFKHFYQVGSERIWQLARFLRRLSIERKDARRTKSGKDTEVVETVHDLEYGNIPVSNSTAPGFAASVSRFPSFYPEPPSSVPPSPFDFKVDRQGKRIYPASNAPIPERPCSRLSSYAQDELTALPTTPIPRAQSMERIRAPRVYVPYSPLYRPLSAQDIRQRELQRAQSRPVEINLPADRPPLSSDFGTSGTSSPSNSISSERSSVAVRKTVSRFIPIKNYRGPPPVHVEEPTDDYTPRQATIQPYHSTPLDYTRVSPSDGLRPRSGGVRVPVQRTGVPVSLGRTRSPAPSVLSHPSNTVIEE